MTTLNKSHVEFAVGLKFRHSTKIANPTFISLKGSVARIAYITLATGGGTAIGCKDIAINLDFLREVPIEDETAYISALIEILGLPADDQWYKEDFIKFHNATLAQRLEAIYKSQGGSK